MTKEQLRHLALLPKVISALRAQADELEELRAQMQRVGMAMPGQAREIHRPAPPPNLPPPPQATTAVLMTPEREEYLAQQRALRAAPPPTEPKPLDQLPAAQRRAIESGYMSGIQAERENKMGQFVYDGTDDIHAGQVVGTEQLKTLSGAT